MTLHEAMIKVLEETGRPMTPQQVADRLNETGWYRKKDGSKITVFQVLARCSRYSHLFDLTMCLLPADAAAETKE